MARSAEAAGADALVVADGRSRRWNPNAIRASTGAVFTLPVVEATLEEVAALGVALVAAVVGAPTPYTDADLAAPAAIVVGAEDDGPRRRVARGCRRSASRSRSPRAAPTASTPRPQPRSCSSRRCASVVDRDDVLRARPVVARHLARTPMLSSRTLGARLKCELFQRTGSFKSRGALNKLATPERRRRRRAG